MFNAVKRTRRHRTTWLFLSACLAGLTMGGCQTKCDCGGDSVEDVVDEVGDEVEDAIEEVKKEP